MRREQRPAGIGEAVEDDPAVAPRRGESGRAERAEVMADEVLGAASDPGEVTDAQLTALPQCQREGQPRRIPEGLGARRGGLNSVRIEVPADRLGAWQVEAEQVAAVVGQAVILTSVAVFQRHRSAGDRRPRHAPREGQRLLPPTELPSLLRC